jgi:ABC-type transporter Mla subunit MlaD
MRRHFFAILGTLELTAAAALVALAALLPSAEEVRESFEGTRQVTGGAGQQLRLTRLQVEELRQEQLPQIASRLGEANQALNNVTRRYQIDFDSMAPLGVAMGQSADGLDALAEALDPKSLGDLAEQLVLAADAIEQRIVPTAEEVADQLLESAEPLSVGTRRLAQALEILPPDLTPIRVVHDTLSQLDDGLVASEAMLNPQRISTMRQAAVSAQEVVAEAAKMADRASGYTYPAVEMDGLRPTVRPRPFWPQADQIAADLRKVAAGMGAIEGQADDIVRELPRVRASIAEGRRGISATRQTLADALKRQQEVEQLLQDLPMQTAKLAEELPEIISKLADALRETRRLESLATSLRATSEAIAAGRKSWPQIRSGLQGTAGVLRAAQVQIELAVRHREEYEAALAQVEGLSNDFAEALPEFAGRIDTRLAEQDQALATLEKGITQVDHALPAYERSLLGGLMIGRLLAWMVAGIAALHGLSLILSDRFAQRQLSAITQLSESR